MTARAGWPNTESSEAPDPGRPGAGFGDAMPAGGPVPGTLDRRRFLFALLGAAAAVGIGGCTSSGSGSRAPAGSRPTIRLPDGALGFPSPFASNGGPGYQQMSLVYDTLLWTDAGGNLLPWLARSYRVSEDHLTYTFELRDGVRWSDGRPFTSDDVVFTFDYYAKLGSLSPPVIIQPPQGIAHVRPIGPGTVEVVLERAAVTFLAQVAGALPIVPRHIWSTVSNPSARLDIPILVGTGPYRVKSYGDDGGPLLYTARDDYWLGTPFVKRIEMNAIDDQFGGLLSGGSDIARGFGVHDEVLAPFRAAPQQYGMVSSVGGFVTHQLYWNLGKGSPLADVRFRQACALAIDRRNLLTRLSSGRGSPGNPGFLGPENPFAVPVRQYEFDVAGANALLDSAGYRPGSGGIRQTADGKPLSFELRYDNVAGVPLSEILIPALRRVGVELRGKPATLGPDLFGPKLFGGYEMAVLPYPGPAPGGPNADPDVLRVMFSSRQPGYSLTAASGYLNPAFDDLADEQLVTFDGQRRRAVVAQMQGIIADDIPILPLFYPEYEWVFRRHTFDQWYFTPGEYPTLENNKQPFITGTKSGTTIRGRT